MKKNGETLYVIIRPEKKIYKLARHLQKMIDLAYDLYDGKLPMLHITAAEIMVSSENGVNSVKKKLDELTSQLEAVDLKTEGFLCFDSSYQSLAWKVKRTDSLVNLAQKLETNLEKLPGLELKGPEINERIFHLTLASTAFTSKSWPGEAYEKLCKFLSQHSFNLSEKADHVELWHPVLNKEDAVIGSYKLKETSNII